MRFRIGMVTLGLVAVSTSASAQGAAKNANCAGVTADACQQVVDLFNYMAPQLGTALVGGNTTLAQGGNMGGRTLGLMPKFAIDVRINAVMGNIPQLQAPTVTLPSATAPPAARAFTTATSFVALPAIDAAVGVFGGIPIGVSSVGGVDLLLSAAYVPSVDLDQISVKPDNPYKFGYGVRIGLLKEGLAAPGIGFSIIQRALPKTTITGKAGTGVTATTVAIKDLDLKATSDRKSVV